MNNKMLKVSKETLLLGFEKLFPEIFYSEENYYHTLMEIIEELEKEGLIELPKGEAHWDFNIRPKFPYWVKIKRLGAKKKNNQWKLFPWHPEMIWVSQVKNLKSQTYLLLKLMNDFFINHNHEKSWIPIKERSIQIFKDEKILDRLIHRKWFKENLSLEKLRCYKTNEPFASKTFEGSVGNKSIIIENRDTFDSFCKANQSLDTPYYKHIIYGCGEFIKDTILWVKEFDSSIKNIEYFGDIDINGLAIPYQLNHLLKENNLSIKIDLARPFYNKLIKVSEKNKFRHSGKPKEEYPLLSFLNKADRIFIGFLFDIGERIAQEELNINLIWEILNS